MLYGSEVYGNACNEYINKLQIQQNRSLKILFQKHYRTHTHDLYTEQNILKITNMKIAQIANLVYEHKQSMLPPVFDEYFTHGNEIHNHLTRTSLNLQIKQPIMKMVIFLNKYQGPQIFSKLLKSIVNSPCFHTFKKKVKTHYLEIQNS